MLSVDLPAETPSLSTAPPTSPHPRYTARPKAAFALSGRDVSNQLVPPSIDSRAICHNGPYIFGQRRTELVLLKFIGFSFLAPHPHPLQDDFILAGVPSTPEVPVRGSLCASLVKQGSVVESLASFN